MPASEAAPTPASARWTREHVLDLMERSPTHWPRYELVDGALLVTPAPGIPHQMVVTRLVVMLDAYVRERQLGWVLTSPADIALAPDRRSIVQPDVFVIPMAATKPTTWRDVPTLLLAVEAVSPGSATHDRGAKREHYLGHGVPEYWIVDPGERHVERWRPGGDRAEMTSDRLVWHPAGAAASLAIELPPLFREAWGEGA